LVIAGGVQGQAVVAGASGVSTSTPSAAPSAGNSVVVSGTAFFAMFVMALIGGVMAV
jgi:hypothetical protein